MAIWQTVSVRFLYGFCTVSVRFLYGFCTVSVTFTTFSKKALLLPKLATETFGRLHVLFTTRLLPFIIATVTVDTVSVHVTMGVQKRQERCYYAKY